MVNTAYKELLESISIHALGAHLEMKLHGYDDPTDCNPCAVKERGVRGWEEEVCEWREENIERLFLTEFCERVIKVGCVGF